MKSDRSRRAGAPVAGSVRIVGGRWRGSKLPVPDLAGLRPSSDRVRETLFNWLMPKLQGARVLDAFAGSGALGFEAVSRGAAHAVLIERDNAAARSLRESLARLHAQDSVSVVAGDAFEWLAGEHPQSFDLVFLDPPFGLDAWARAIDAVQPHLAADAWIYLESPASVIPAVPDDWRLHREGGTREVRSALYRRAGAGR